MHILILTAGRVLGTALLSVLSTLLAGKTFKYLLLYPFVRLSQWTQRPVIAKIVEEAETDLGLSPQDFPTTTKDDKNHG